MRFAFLLCCVKVLPGIPLFWNLAHARFRRWRLWRSFVPELRMPSNVFIETEIETCNLGKCNKTNVPSTCVVRVGAGSGWGGWLVAGPGGCSRHRGWGRNLNLSDNHCVDIHLEVYPEETAGRIGFWKPVAWTGWPLRRTAQGAVSWSPAAGRASNEGYPKVHYANQPARSLWLLRRRPNFTYTTGWVKKKCDLKS